MHCEDCQNLLLDLAYGELDEARAAEVRGHVEGCEPCGAEWTKLQRGRSAAAMLPVAQAPAPSRALVEAIEKSLGKSSSAAAASSTATSSSADRSGARSAKSADASGKSATVAAEARAESKSAPSESAQAEGSNVVPLRGGARWIERVAALAMRREVAMAAVFLMALGVGVTTLYNPSRNPAITEEERSRDVIPAVEVSDNQSPNNERSAQRRGATVDPTARARVTERSDNRVFRAPAPTLANSAPVVSPQPSAAAANSAATRRSEDSPVAPTQPEADNSQLAQQAASPSNSNVMQQRVQNTLSQRAFSNAGIEVAGVQQQATSASEIAARSSLERGDAATAIAQFRAALASATDDVTRARIQRQIASLEASQAAAASAAAQHSQVAASPTSSIQQTNESSYRRARAAPTRATNRARSPSPAGAATDFNTLGF